MDQNLDRAIGLLTRESHSWKAIELTTRQEFVNSTGSSDPNMYQQAVFQEDYIETATGQRFNRVVDRPAGGREKLAEYFCDGEKCADVAFADGVGSKQTQVQIKRGFKYEAQFGTNFRPIPLRYLYYIGNIPLDRALQKAEPLGPATVVERSCDAYLLRRFHWGTSADDLVCTLDRATGVPLRLTGYNEPVRFEGGRPSWRWEALAVDTVQGHLVPMRSEEVVYVTPPDGKDPKARDRSGEVALRTTHTVESIRFDGDYPKSTFWPVIAPEATVFDSIARKVVPSKVKPVVTQVADPIRAEPPRDWTPAASAGGILVGAALIGAGLWSRRRR